MKLLSMELQGFKSFVNKTRLDFNDGITAIVGPNGSGKSNIIEAISWAMGETSSKRLRTDRMTDLIFSGTTDRPAVNLCQVSLSFDNTDRFLPIDVDQLTISRRLTRQGQSDYFINQQPCRLKDIHELFMDSGLGRDSFSIIGQGQVDQILNNKAEERRAIFEEAAGVLKYKNRKHQAQAKLDQTQSNLDRLKDILYEIDKQRQSLKVESDRAKSYLNTAEQLKFKDSEATAYEIRVRYSQLKELQKEEEQVEDQFKLIQSQLQSYQEQLDRLNQQQSNYDSDLRVIQQKLLEKTQSIEQNQGQLGLLNEQQRFYSKDKQRLNETVDSNQKKLDGLKQKKNQLKKQVEQLNKDKKELEGQAQRLSQDLERNSSSQEERLDQLQLELFELMRLQSQLNNEQGHIEKTALQIKARRERSQQQWNELLAEEQSLLKQKESTESDWQDNNKALESLNQTLEELQREKNKADTLFKKLNADYQQQETSLNRKKAQYQQVEEMRQNYSAYYKGVQAVMKAKDRFPGLIGTVAEVIQVDVNIQLAIDLALGSQSQFIIVEDQQTAQSAIEYLKKTKAGRASFLPLNRMASRYIGSSYEEKIKTHPGYIGRASDLIDYDIELKQGIENLLGHIVICQDINSGRQLSDQLKRRYKVVSLEGDVFNVGGSMTGGSSRSSKLLGQKESSQHLKQTIRQQLAKVKDTKNKIDKQNQRIIQLDQNEKEQVQKIQAIQANQKQLAYQAEQLEDEISRSNKRKKGQQFELQTIQEEQEEWEINQENNSTELKENQQAISQKEEAIKEVQENWQQLQSKQEVKQEQFKAIQDQLLHLKLEQAEWHTQLNNLNDQQEEIQTEQKALEKELEDLDSLRSSDSKEELVQQLQTDQTLKSELEEKQSELQIKKEKGQAKLSETDQLSQELALQKESRQDQLKHIQIDLASKQQLLKQDLNYLNEEYQLSFDDFKPAMDWQKNTLAEVKEQVQVLKQEIKKIGSVNINAIDEFEEYEKRYQFLTSQKEDLLSARKDLHATMKKMDQQAAERFKSSFELIQENFALIFPQIFNGGKAQLSLTDEEDLLHTGIEIKAQPPGKNLKSMNLLSGGERSLTAISLLFAIIKSHPIPFVILDEVEAALDEANVYRLSHYLQNFAQQDMQFLIITHRQGTMEAADQLYGVSMQEKGVSSLLSVQLKEAGDLVNNE